MLAARVASIHITAQATPCQRCQHPLLAYKHVSSLQGMLLLLLLMVAGAYDQPYDKPYDKPYPGASVAQPQTLSCGLSSCVLGTPCCCCCHCCSACTVGGSSLHRCCRLPGHTVRLQCHNSTPRFTCALTLSLPFAPADAVSPNTPGGYYKPGGSYAPKSYVDGPGEHTTRLTPAPIRCCQSQTRSHHSMSSCSRQSKKVPQKKRKIHVAAALAAVAVVIDTL